VLVSFKGVIGAWKNLAAQDEKLKKRLYEQQSNVYVQCKESNTMIGVVKHVHNNTCKVEWIIFTHSQLNAVSTNKEGYIKESRLNILVPESFVYEKQRKVDILVLYYFTLTDIVSLYMFTTFGLIYYYFSIKLKGCH
jgi:hypothetical protein